MLNNQLGLLIINLFSNELGIMFFWIEGDLQSMRKVRKLSGISNHKFSERCQTKKATHRSEEKIRLRRSQ